jgi:hypothetical protein
MRKMLSAIVLGGNIRMGPLLLIAEGSGTVLTTTLPLLLLLLSVDATPLHCVSIDDITKLLRWSDGRGITRQIGTNVHYLLTIVALPYLLLPS